MANKKIKKFTLNIPEATLKDLHDRLENTRLSESNKEDDWSRGVPLNYIKKLINYWRNDFDWRKQEARLNKLPQFSAEIDKQTIHFFHVKSTEKNAMPLILLHGWPSSGIEFLKLIEPLTDPVSHGGKAEDAFDVIIPTTPGFGLSYPVKEHWDSQRTARAYSGLVKELGYTKWGVHGGDVGSDIAGEINHIDNNLVGVHVSTDMPAIIWFAVFTGNDPSKNPKFSKAEIKELEKLKQSGSEDGGYLEIQKTRPRTIGYGLDDSPVGQLAWIIEKYHAWTDPNKKSLEEAIDIDQALINISLYWFTKSGSSAADYLCTNLHAQRDWSRPSFAPMGMAVFGAKSTARAIQDPEKQIKHWSEFKKGGHFPAMEVPSLLAGDLRKFFRKFRVVK